MNPFFDFGKAKEPPMFEGRRLYARITSIDPEPDAETEEPRTVLFEAIDADQFDGSDFSTNQGASNGNFAETAVKWRLSILECLQEKGFEYGQLQNVDDNTWFEIVVELSSIEVAPVLQYTNLFAAPEPRVISKLRHLSKRDGKIVFDLDSMVDTDEFVDADETDIIKALNGETIFGVAAFDVGQGNWQGLLNAEGTPVAYFDVGGGVLGHRDTFPPALNAACFAKKPPIILSHWDWDHWSSAQRFTDALEMTWIVPRQSIGPVARVFLYNIVKKGSVLFWPSGKPSISVGQIKVSSCTGRGKNHSGLAVAISGPNPFYNEDILLTGDCNYIHIRDWDRSYRHVVVPHHGAKMTSKKTPHPEFENLSCAVISRGKPNQWGHPDNETLKRHLVNNWSRFRDLGRGPRLCDSGDHHLLHWDTPPFFPSRHRFHGIFSPSCFECPYSTCDFDHFTV